VSGGIVALFDDVAAMAKLAAASVDDVAAAASRASTKAEGVVVDDTAVTPRYVHGFTQIGEERQLLIVRAEERGTVRKGDVVHALPDASRVHVFDTATGARL